MERSNGHTGRTKGLQIHHVTLLTTDAPFLAISSLQRLVKDKMADPNITEVEKLVCSTIKRDTYVDDITTGGKDVNEALAVYKGMTSMLGSAGFKIRKWATNSKELLQQIPAEERAPTKEIIKRAGPTTISEATSSLGVRWDPQTDDIVYDCYGKIHKKNDDTKTAVASLLATPFDPLGGLAPFVLLARRVMKETHVLGLGWKDKIPEPLMPEWHDWVEMTKGCLMSGTLATSWITTNRNTTYSATPPPPWDMG